MDKEQFKTIQKKLNTLFVEIADELSDVQEATSDKDVDDIFADGNKNTFIRKQNEFIFALIEANKYLMGIKNKFEDTEEELKHCQSINESLLTALENSRNENKRLADELREAESLTEEAMQYLGTVGALMRESFPERY